MNDLRNREAEDSLIIVVSARQIALQSPAGQWTPSPQLSRTHLPSWSSTRTGLDWFTGPIPMRPSSCNVHFVRHCGNVCGWKDRKTVATDLKRIYQATDDVETATALADLEAEWGRKYLSTAPSWRRAEQEVIPFLDGPPERRRPLYTTNLIGKMFLLVSALPFLCGRPGGEAWRVGWTRHREAHQSLPV